MSRILIVGADGMIGFGLYTYFSQLTDRDVYASIRSKRDLACFGENWRGQVLVSGSIDDDDKLDTIMANAEPDLVINCAGATMHADQGESPLVALPANSLLPHRLHAASRRVGARFLHLSTDCVFDGARGGYSESEAANAKTVYGLSKALGEVTAAEDAVTIRTSPIGYEISSQRGLLAWFLAQSGPIKGFTNAFFTGLTNLHLARTIDRYFVDDPAIHGLFHVTGPKISKFDLLVKCAEHFANPIDIAPDGQLVLDRSLDGEKMVSQLGYVRPSWDEMLADLADFARFYPNGTVTRGGTIAA